MANNTQSNSNTSNGTSTVWQIVGRLVTAAIVLAITAFFTPGFSINNIWALAIAAIVLTIMDYLIVKFTGLHASPFGKGFVEVSGLSSAKLCALVDESEQFVSSNSN